MKEGVTWKIRLPTTEYRRGRIYKPLPIRHIREGFYYAYGGIYMKVKQVKHCSWCGDKERRMLRIKYNGELVWVCSRCYQRFKRWGTQHPLPPKGVIQYDSEGKPICHICGYAFNKLMSHVWQIHGMNEREYKTEFSLLFSSIMSEEATDNARTGFNKHRETSIEHLAKVSEATRFTKGHSAEANKRVCLQRAELLRTQHIRNVVQREVDQKC